MADAPAVPLDNWKQRRRIIKLTLLYCAAHLSYLTFFGKDTVLEQQLVYAFTGIAGAVLTGYLGFAVWDDHNKMKFNNQG